MHALDNPIWSALNTRQAALGLHHGVASKFDPEISLLGGFATTDFEALARVVVPGELVGIFGDEPVATSAFEIVLTAPLLQMLYAPREAEVDPSVSAPIVALTNRDTAEMIALAELTKPGPFARRTREMGEFFGIRVGGQLVAMAGQRLRVPDYIEISGICTHPDFLGRGYGAALTRWQVRTILEAGEHPFLHVRGDNTRAIALYERLGFVPRLRSQYIVLRRLTL